MNEYQTIKGWAVNDVADQKSRKAILRAVKYAFDKNTKTWTWLTFLYQLGEHKNLVNAVNSIDVVGRVKTETLQSCWVCGTPHNDTYHARFKDRDVFIGNVCAKENLAKYGLNTGVLSTVDDKSARFKTEEVSNDLDALVSEEPRPVTILAHTPAKKNENYLYAQVQWVLNQKRVPKDVRAAAKDIHDTFTRPGRAAVKTILDYVEKARKFPAEAYEPIAKDLEHMGRKDLAQMLRSGKELTSLKAMQICCQAEVDPIKYRIEKNTAFLKQYEPEGKSLATILEEIIPAVEHDKQLWRDDLLAQEYRFNKVLSPEDYRLVSKCLKRWAFGSTQHLQGADRLRLRNIALRIEPVEDFGREIDGLIAIGRKLQYAKDHSYSVEQAKLEKIREDISSLPNSQKFARIKQMVSAFSEQINDPCRLLQAKSMTVEAFERKYDQTLGTLVDKVDRSYALNSSIWARNHPQVEGIKDRVKYGIITTDDVKLLQVLERCVNKYTSIDKLHLKNEIKGLQEAVTNPLVVSVPFANDKKLFSNADCFDSMVKQTFYQWTLVGDGSNRRDYAVKIAADDWFTLKAKLYQNNLTEKQVLEMKAKLKGVPDDQLIGGKQMKYICPVKVKDQYDKRK